MDKWKSFLIGGYIGFIISLFNVIFALIICPFVFSVIPYHIAFVAIPFLFLSIIDILWAQKHKGEFEEKYFLPHGSIMFTKRRIRKWIKEDILDGKGTSTEPYKFVYSSKLPSNLKIKIKGTKSHILIRNCQIDEIMIENSKNIKIFKNKIKFIRLENSFNIEISENFISYISYEYSFGIVITKNEIPKSILDGLKTKKESFPYADVFCFLMMIAFGFGVSNWFIILAEDPSLLAIVVLYLLMLIPCLLALRGFHVIRGIRLYRKSHENLNIIKDNRT